MSVPQEEDLQSVSVENNLTGRVILNRYKLSDVIGQGSYGEIILGTDITNDERVAIKIEKIKYNKTTKLEMESIFYKMIGSEEDGFPIIHFFGQYKRFNVMVMELLGPNLESVFNNCGQHFTLKTIIYIFLQLLQRIEHIHNCNLIYQDVKPENFLLGREGTPKLNVIHIIDLGLAKQYYNPETKTHIPMSKKQILVGTARYMSINCHLGYEQSRRDDLESIGYMIMYFLNQGKLPWMGIKADSIKELNKNILDQKRGIAIETLCEGHPQQFSDYFRSVRRLEFEERPDYYSLKSLFIKLFESEKFEDDGYYDWN